MEWISVRERLPPTKGEVLVYGHFCNGALKVGIAYVTWIGNRWKDPNFLSDDVMTNVDGFGMVVTHWMPLPDPPQS